MDPLEEKITEIEQSFDRIEDILDTRKSPAPSIWGRIHALERLIQYLWLAIVSVFLTGSVVFALLMYHTLEDIRRYDDVIGDIKQLETKIQFLHNIEYRKTPNEP